MLNEIDSSIYHKTEWKNVIVKLMEPFWKENGDFNMDAAARRYADGGIDAAATILTAAMKGDHFVIERHFQELIAQAAKTLPEDTIFSRDAVISPCGWMELADPINGKFEEGPLAYTTFAWFISNDQLIGVCLPRTPSLCGDVGGFRHTLDKPVGNINLEIRVLYSAMRLMQDKISVMHKQTVTKPRIVKEAKKHLTFREVNVVVLRRAYQKGEPNGHHYNTNHEFQWSVVGHWRKQPYKSVGEVRPIFIETYVKGPSDKPLRMRTNIFVARR